MLLFNHSHSTVSVLQRVVKLTTDEVGHDHEMNTVDEFSTLRNNLFVYKTPL